MVLATVATHHQRIGNMSFPRTITHSPNSYESDSHYLSQPSPSPWFSCNADRIQSHRETENVSSRVETFHHYRMHDHEPVANGRRRRQMRLQSQNNPPRKPQQQPKPNYPTTIEVGPIQKAQAPLDGESHIQRQILLRLEDRDERLSLDDSFGFDDNTKSDALFEILYHELDEEDGTLQSSIDLNPYSPKDFVRRREWNNQSGKIIPFPASNVEVAVDKKYTHVISPTMAMDRRRSSKRHSCSHHTNAVVSPASSVFTNPDPLCAHTGSAIRRTTTGVSITPSHNRSTSRNHRSCSISGPRAGRSRSRSTSVARTKNDHNSNIFRGAALVREQLLRSMLSADHAMDEAKREFNEEIIERGGRRQAIKSKKFDHNGNGDIISTFRGYQNANGGGATSSRNLSTPSRSNCERIATSTKHPPACAESQDSCEFETESRRLDNLIGILQSTSFASGSNLDSAFKSLVSDNEDSQAQLDTDATEAEKACIVTSIVSPALSSEVNSLRGEPKKQFISTEEENNVSLEKKQLKHSTAVVDDALAHAQNAGPLWRSLVGNHVRFPSKWDEILPPSSPEIHSIYHKWSKWYYVARHRVKGDKRLNSRQFGVRSRRSGGRILLRLVIREFHSQQVCREIAIGCFHPNSKGIRKGDPLPETEDVREVWMAVRWVMEIDDVVPTLRLSADGGENDYDGVVDRFLMQKRDKLDSGEMGSALGHRKAVSNENVRAVLGDQPPLTSVDLNDDEFADILKANGAMKLAVLPALMILKLFLFSKK